MLTAAQACAILDQIQPFKYTEALAEKLGADFWFIRKDRLEALGVKEADLSDQMFYCGTDKREGEEGYVIQKSVLARFILVPDNECHADEVLSNGKARSR